MVFFMSSFVSHCIVGEDAQEEGINLKDLFERKQDFEVKDPKKTLNGFFEREGSIISNLSIVDNWFSIKKKSKFDKTHPANIL